ncbi:MAG: FAD-dependent monooxygenase [Actinobacteria bacterium]|nr:FAD-dependent monooxygenase [Actinomycetota bacterium]
MTIAIIGAGIGGLVTALSLHKAGFGDIRVYERVRELRPLGVGINLLPHAVRELTVNFIAEQRSDGSRAETVDWNRQVPIAPIAELFSAWRFDWLDVPAVIANAHELLEYPMVDRDPLPRWTFGRSTLLGDAAHAMYPNGSNGASQAIIDARTLAYSLATSGDLADGLRRYEEARRPATADLLALTRQQGPERVMVLAHERAPEGFADIEDVIPAAELQEIADGYKRTAGFHPEALNTRASLDARLGQGA